MGHFHPFPIAMLKKQRVHDGFGRVIKGSTPPIWIEYWSFMVFQFGNPGRGSGKQQAASVAATMVTTPPVGGTVISLMLWLIRVTGPANLSLCSTFLRMLISLCSYSTPIPDVAQCIYPAVNSDVAMAIDRFAVQTS